jgi:alpha/beta superfamily hydrolase
LLRGKCVTRFLGATLLTIAAAMPALVSPAAFAKPCADVEVVFARGSDEPPGVGKVGKAFVDALRSDLTGRSIAVYAVKYPAVGGFSSGLDFQRSVIAGIRDEAAHIEWTTVDCPETPIVLGGYSQGAAVTGFVTSPSVPEDVPADLVPNLPEPMPAEVADRVAALALFGKPSAAFIRRYGAPPITIGPLYAFKTIELCARDDTVCTGASGGIPFGHFAYPTNGMARQAADFAASRVKASSTPRITLHRRLG